MLSPAERRAYWRYRHIGRYRARKLEYRQIGNLEVWAPANIQDYELVRALGETDAEYENAKSIYSRLFQHFGKA
jgi:hypothetical protein